MANGRSPLSGIGGHIQLALGEWSPQADLCAALKAAWNRQGSISSRAWHASYNAWAAELGCPLLNSGVGTGSLSTTDRADIEYLQSGAPPVPVSPVAPKPLVDPPPPKGGPPPGDRVVVVDPIPPPGDEAPCAGMTVWECEQMLQTSFLGGIFGTIVNWISSGAGWVWSKIPTGNNVCGWAKDRKQMLEKSQGSNWTHIGYADEIGAFVYSSEGSDGPWKVPYCRIGQDFLAGDITLPATAVVTETYPVANVGGGTGTGVGPYTGGAGGGLGITELLGPGSPPTVTQRRTCPPQGGIKMRLAVNGMCYPKALLPAQFYMSKSMRSTFTARDRQTVQKAKRLQEKLRGLAEDYAPTARRRRPEHHHHHHE